MSAWIILGMVGALLGFAALLVPIAIRLDGIIREVRR